LDARTVGGPGVGDRAGGQRLDGVVGEDEPEPGLIGPVVVDLELQGVVELALDRFGRLGDVDAGEDRHGVEQFDVPPRLHVGGGSELDELSGLLGAFGFEGVEAAA
jgi:hypothetical protein